MYVDKLLYIDVICLSFFKNFLPSNYKYPKHYGTYFSNLADVCQTFKSSGSFFTWNIHIRKKKQTKKLGNCLTVTKFFFLKYILQG